MLADADDDRVDAYSDVTVNTWEIHLPEWEALAKLHTLLTPFKFVTKELEVDTYPIIHAAGRAMLYLALVAPALDLNQAAGDPVKEEFIKAAKSKMCHFLDDPPYLRELAIAQFFDPRFKDLMIYSAIWGSSHASSLFTNCHMEWRHFEDFRDDIHTSVKDGLRDLSDFLYTRTMDSTTVAPSPTPTSAVFAAPFT